MSSSFFVMINTISMPQEPDLSNQDKEELPNANIILKLLTKHAEALASSIFSGIDKNTVDIRIA